MCAAWRIFSLCSHLVTLCQATLLPAFLTGCPPSVVCHLSPVKFILQISLTRCHAEFNTGSLRFNHASRISRIHAQITATTTTFMLRFSAFFIFIFEIVFPIANILRFVMRGNPKFMRGKCFHLKLVVYVFKIQPIYSIIILDSYLLYFIFIMQYVSYHNLPYKNDYTKEYLVFIHNEIIILQFFIVHIYKIAFMFFFYVYIYQILLLLI